MSITKVVTYFESGGEIIKEKTTLIEDLTVRFKVGSSELGKASRYSKVFHLEDPEFDTGSYYQYFYKCLLHLEMSTNRIVFHTHIAEPNKSLTEDDFIVLFDCSDKTVKRFLKLCIDKNIMARIDKNGKLWGYIINPLYALNGNQITSMLYCIFGENGELDKHIPHKDLIAMKEYLKIKPLADKLVLGKIE